MRLAEPHNHIMMQRSNDVFQICTTNLTNGGRKRTIAEQVLFAPIRRVGNLLHECAEERVLHRKVQVGAIGNDAVGSFGLE
jgi:hypothetical protein